MPFSWVRITSSMGWVRAFRYTIRCVPSGLVSVVLVFQRPVMRALLLGFVAYA